MSTVTQPRTRRNEGGRYSAKNGSNWYAAIEAANIQAVEDAARTLTTALAHQVGNAVTAMPEAASRITKAATLVQHRDVWPMTDGTFLVGSESQYPRINPWACRWHVASQPPKRLKTTPATIGRLTTAREH